MRSQKTTSPKTGDRRTGIKLLAGGEPATATKHVTRHS
jgi:hypothetical protein